MASRNRAQITRTVQAAVVGMLREGDMPAVGALPTLRNAGAQVGHSTEQLLAVRYVYGKISALPCATVAMHRSSTRRVSWFSVGGSLLEWVGMLIFYVEGAHERTRQRKHSPLYTLWDGGRVKNEGYRWDKVTERRCDRLDA